MGFNDSFAQSRSQILMTVPSPTLNQTYNMIMQDESQRVQSGVISNCVLPLQKIDVSDSIALVLIQNNKFKQSTGLYCDHCHLRNHIRANCYRFAGYHPNPKFAKKKGVDDGGNRGQTFNSTRSQNFGGNIWPQANNANYVEGNDARNRINAEDQQNFVGNKRPQMRNADGFEARNTTVDSFLPQTVPIFRPDKYNQLINMFNKDASSQDVIANMTGPLQ